MNYHDDEVTEIEGPSDAPDAMEAANVPAARSGCGGSEDELFELAGEMRGVWNAMVRGISHTGRLEGLQRQQTWILVALEHGPKKMTALAECSSTAQNSLTGIIDRLEERGLVERIRSNEDRRVVEVALTPAGREETVAAHNRMAGRLAQVLDPLTADERRELLRLMRKIRVNNQ